MINKILFFLIFTCFLSNFSFANSNKFIVYKSPWIKFIAKNQKNLSGYLILKNTSDKAIKLISVNSNFAEKTEIHKMKIENNVMKMERIKTGILILPNKEVLFKPGGLHIMFRNIKNKLNLDDEKKVFFNFEKNGTIEIMMKVKKGYHSKKHNH